MAGQRAVMPGGGIVLTEAGYYSLPGGGSWGGVDLTTQAKPRLLNLLFDAAKLGVSRTYLYQLLDAYPDPSNTDMEKHFGLFDINNKPKPVAAAIHNLTTILADSGSVGRRRLLLLFGLQPSHLRQRLGAAEVERRHDLIVERAGYLGRGHP